MAQKVSIFWAIFFGVFAGEAASGTPVRVGLKSATQTTAQDIMSISAQRLAILIFVLAWATGAASAGTITCVPAAGNGPASPFNWVRRIAIDEHSRTVNLDVVRSRTKDTETMGKMRADLVHMEDSPSGEPAYVFNSIPTAGAEATHLFRLSKAGEWRLISASVVVTNKLPALRAVEQGVVFDCKRSDLG